MKTAQSKIKQILKRKKSFISCPNKDTTFHSGIIISLHSHPSVSPGSGICGFNQLWSKIFRKKLQKISESETWILCTLVSVYMVCKAKFYWSIVALKCYVTFCCAEKWVSHTYTYIHSLIFPSQIQVTTWHWGEFPVLYSRFSLVTYFINSRVYMSIPISSQKSSHPTFSLGNHKCVLYNCDSIAALQISSSVPVFSILHISDIMPHLVFSF